MLKGYTDISEDGVKVCRGIQEKPNKEVYKSFSFN